MNIVVRQTSALAVASLITGILGWTLVPVLGSICAIVTGHLARSEIRRNPHGLEGDGLAVTGLILGWLSLAMLVGAAICFLLFFGGMAWLLATHG
ncbi:DUF4190 domain-containing protein [Xanthomonas maliensis]|uniref:DUF4190 domain-containing protein n=1 Tax=Xanthomonas maliensis TaxID=1321368 RepID=UPI0004CEAF6A|nr:DUF4190 domain-containing protein [Xanthomonas maliensis]